MPVREYDMDMLRIYCLECFEYKPDTGSFKWKERPLNHFKRKCDWVGFNTAHAGKDAGSVGNKGYMGVGLLRKRMQVHRLVWLMFYGEMPDLIDHINGDRKDQRISNLRNVNVTANNRNRAGVKHRPDGSNGVYWCVYHKKYRARLKANGRDLHIGYFDTIEEARTARKQAEISSGFHPNHGRPSAEINHAKD